MTHNKCQAIPITALIECVISDMTGFGVAKPVHLPPCHSAGAACPPARKLLWPSLKTRPKAAGGPLHPPSRAWSWLLALCCLPRGHCLPSSPSAWPVCSEAQVPPLCEEPGHGAQVPLVESWGSQRRCPPGPSVPEVPWWSRGLQRSRLVSLFTGLQVSLTSAMADLGR